MNAMTQTNIVAAIDYLAKIDAIREARLPADRVHHKSINIMIHDAFSPNTSDVVADNLANGIEGAVAVRIGPDQMTFSGILKQIGDAKIVIVSVNRGDQETMLRFMEEHDRGNIAATVVYVQKRYIGAEGRENYPIPFPYNGRMINFDYQD